MTKRELELEREIELLKMRIAALEARPIYVPVPFAVPANPVPYYPPAGPGLPFIWCRPASNTAAGVITSGYASH